MNRVARRTLLHLGGYDPVRPEDQHRLFGRELARYARTWGLTASASALTVEPDGLTAGWTAETTGPDWKTHTTYRVLRWDDLVAADMARATPGRLARALVTLADFAGTGTALRYVRASWPYALFFCFPFAALALFAAVAGAVGVPVATKAGVPAGAAAGVALFVVLYATVGRHWRVAQALDDWDFARGYVRGHRPEVGARIEKLAEVLLAEARAGAADEIVLVGHSFGATLALELLARALDREPGLRVRLLTVGATIPKLGLHPRGARVRACAARVAAAPGLAWAEYQACDDPISFYKVDPLSLRRQRTYEPGSRPMVRRAHVREMLAPETYRRFRHRWVRLHYQFLMANDQPARYDFFMFACGPLSFDQIVATPGGPAALFAADGSVRAAP
ncbi:MAG: hypothetical protein JNL39_05430 [Opitutaceae bacterium]|nr:hypothetical protein [Opitutaceae bacterium]